MVKTKQKCSVPNCCNVAGPRVALYHFPKKKGLLKKWKSFCNIRKSGALSKNCMICSDHFAFDCFISQGLSVNPNNTTNKSLTDNAIPTILTKETEESNAMNVLESAIKNNDNFDSSLMKCRICLLTSNDLENIFNEDKFKPNCADRIVQCSVIKISKNDGFPENICRSCVVLLENAYHFKLLCEQSDQILRSDVMNNSKAANVVEIKKFDESCSIDSTQVQYDESKIIPSNLEIEPVYYLSDVDGHLDSDESCEESFKSNLENIKSSRTTEIKRDEDWTVETNISKKIKTTPKCNEKKKKVVKEKRKRINSNIKNYQCDECGYMAAFPAKLEIHKQFVHHGIRIAKCPNCPKSFADNHVLQCHLGIVHTNDPVVCDLCGKTFKNPKLLSQHRRRHIIEKKFKCHLCPYEALTKASVTIHMTQHTGEQQFECSECKKTFKAKSNLLTHIRLIHQNSRQFKCNLCDKRFKLKSTLRKHEVVHSGLKPFACPLCPITYSWYNGLSIHQRNTHPELQLDTELVMYKKFMSNRTDTD